jgi:hypothetical protein
MVTILEIITRRRMLQLSPYGCRHPGACARNTASWSSHLVRTGIIFPIKVP